MDAAGILGLTDLELPHDAFASGGSFQPMDVDGDAEPPVVPSPQKKSAKKRARPKKTRGGAAGTGVVIFGDRFVCSYSGEFTERAVFIPGLDDVAFLNLPCAFAYLEDQGDDFTPEKVQELKAAALESYEQDSCERAPTRKQLANFGGDKYYDEWIGHLHFWDRLTERSGLTVAQFQQKRDSGGLTAHKRGGGANTRVSFESAPYVIAYGKGPAGCRIINALDGSVNREEGEVVDAKKTMSMVRALRKLTTFCNGHQDRTFEVCSASGDGYYAFFVRTSDEVDANDKRRNHIATKILGNPTAYGPAVFIFTRKYSQRI